MGCQTIGGRSPSFEDAVSQCAVLSRPGSPDCPPATRRPRTDVSRLPGLFRVGSSSYERLDSSTPDGHTTRARQLSRRAVEDAVPIQSPEGGSLGSDLATRPGEWRNGAGKLASLYITPGSSFWGHRPSSHRRTENAGGYTNKPRVLSALS